MTFHWYGLIIGVAIVVSLQLVEAQARRFAPRLITHPRFWQLVLGTCLGGLIGARLWHVATAWAAYADHPASIFYIWEGGLSILGAVTGGLMTASWLLRWLRFDTSFLTLSDLVVFALPFGQAVGRVGNYFNQELYGLPARRLPWSIGIDESHRFPEFMAYPRYHPLFLYELLALLIFGYWMWLAGSMHRKKIGSGFFLTWYVMMYSWVRFWLDFLRLDRDVVLGGMLGVNQIVLSLVFVACLTIAFRRNWARHMRGLVAGLLIFACIVFGLWTRSEQQLPSLKPWQAPVGRQLQLSDHQRVDLEIGSSHLEVEVVTTPQSWTRGLSGRGDIGSDGLLFIFPKKEMRHFWMVDMQFDLDMIWFADGKVLGVTDNVPKPAPDQAVEELPTYISPSAADWVLEIPAGMASKYGIQPGMNGMIRTTSP